MNEIIYESGIIQDRAALMEDGQLVELYIEGRVSKRIVSNIYKGRVTNVLPGMNAAFVDIGHDKNAFLHAKDAVPSSWMSDPSINVNEVNIKDVIKNGQEIIVQIIKEPVGTKGARVTTHLSFAGRYLVILPGVTHVGISRRIENADEKNRLKEIVNEMLPENMGVIIRTEASHVDAKEIKDDLKYLIKLWLKIDSERNHGFAPKVLYKDLGLMERVIRDVFSSEVDRFIVKNKIDFNRALEFIDLASPALSSKVEIADAGLDLFDQFGIEAMVKNAITRKVWLKSGGYIIIDETEALTSIDVNTGKFVGSTGIQDTIFQTNFEAAIEIAKQLRLRNIGGIIIVDFIDMHIEENVEKVLACLEDAFKKDKTKTDVHSITKLGLVEITRKKLRKRLSSLTQTTCKTCKGTGMILSDEVVLNRLVKELERLAVHTDSEVVVIGVSESLFEMIMHKDEYSVQYIEEQIGIELIFNIDDSIYDNDYRIKFMGSKKNAHNFLNHSID